MSSLAATQADGYYLPPEYYDSGTYKKKSKNAFAKSKGHNQYEQSGVVRFELP
jgi:coiled-coil domain-containing protein 130